MVELCVYFGLIYFPFMYTCLRSLRIIDDLRSFLQGILYDERMEGVLSSVDLLNGTSMLNSTQNPLNLTLLNSTSSFTS